MANVVDSTPVRGCIGLAGVGLAGLSLALLVTSIISALLGQLPPEAGIAGLIGASVLLLASTAVGGALAWWGWRGTLGRQHRADVETAVLDAAERRGGRLTPAQLATETDLSLADSEDVLDRLARDSHLRIDVGTGGEEVYVFPGLESGETRTPDEQLEADISLALDQQEKSQEH